VAWDAKKRIRTGWCLVAGVAEQHSECTYHLRYKQDGKWMWESVGDDPNTAMTLPSSRSYTEGVKAAAAEEAPVPAAGTAAEVPDSTSIPTPGKFRLDEEIKTYLTNCEKLAPRSHKAYRLTLVDLFPQSCKKIYVHQITQQDLQAFDSFLLKRGDEDRTRANRGEHVTTFLRNKEGRRAGPPILGVSITIKYLGFKHDEFRSKFSHYRGPVVIHSSKKWHTPALREFVWTHFRNCSRNPNATLQALFPLQSPVADAVVQDCKQWTDDPTIKERFALRLTQVRIVTQPKPAFNGMLSVPWKTEKTKELASALARARVLEGTEKNLVYEEFAWLALRNKINLWLKREGLEKFALTPPKG
jgi:hypothetical protein